MKKIVIPLIVLFCAGLASAQQTFRWPGGPSENQVHVIPMYIPTETDYVSRNIGTANDTTQTYKLPKFDKMWVVAKVVQDTSGDDSVDVNIWVEGKSSQWTLTGYTTRCDEWDIIDSMAITTADTLGGESKLINFPPYYDQVRVVIDGITGNEAEVGNQEAVWTVLQY